MLNDVQSAHPLRKALHRMYVNEIINYYNFTVNVWRFGMTSLHGAHMTLQGVLHCCCSYLIHMPRLSSGLSSLSPGPKCTLNWKGKVWAVRKWTICAWTYRYKYASPRKTPYTSRKWWWVPPEPGGGFTREDHPTYCPV